MEIHQNYFGIIEFTAKALLKSIAESASSERKEWLLGRFEKAGKEKANITKYQFWQHNNHPIEVYSKKVIKQKVDYTHNNPVKAGLVLNAVDWKYSSARKFMEHPDCAIEIDNLGFIG